MNVHASGLLDDCRFGDVCLRTMSSVKSTEDQRVQELQDPFQRADQT